VTVLLPFRDCEAFFEESLESLRSQTFEQIEVLLVDDHSTDGSPAIALEFCGRDPRFRLVSCKGRGLVDSLNTGLALARGEWIARQDADDISHPERVEAQYLSALETCDSRTVISCRTHSFRKGGLRDGYRLYEEWINSLVDHSEIEANIFVESPVPHPTAFYARSPVLEAGGYRHGDFPEDYELWLRLWTRGFRFRRVPRVLLEWRDHPFRLSRTDPRYSVTAFYRLKSMYLSYAPALSDRRVVVWGSGQAARRLSGFLLREGFRIEAFVTIVPDRVGRLLRGAPVIAASDLERFEGTPVLVASRARGAREEIELYLRKSGRRNWIDYILCT
jgi:glycosyltransferase involved in cell wall biosynthesis